MKPEKDTKCGVCAVPSFERNNFFYGKQITVRDSVQEQFFFNETRHLINRMVLGWGVVCGLDVHWNHAKRQFDVDPGLALDCCGREILVCGPAHIPFDEYEEHCKCARERREPPKGRYILCLEYVECKTEPVELPPLSCDTKERQEYNRIKQSFRLQIKLWEDGKKPEEVCLKHPYGHVACLDRFKKPVSEIAKDPKCHTPTIQDYLCWLSKKGCPECECCDCVVLGVVHVGEKHEEAGYGQQQGQEQQQHQGQEQYEHPAQQEATPRPSDDQPTVRIDKCAYRRLVYGNPLLYDLIYCHHGDLPHIVDFSWRQHTRPDRKVAWGAFVDMIGKEGLTLTFDQEMIPASLNPYTFLVTFLDVDEGTGTLMPKRIPAKSIVSKPGPCFTATWVADPDWVSDELKGKHSQLADGVDVEVIVRGSHVWSTKGKALDGEFIADELPTGNGVQGGDFVDWFTVLPRESKAKAYDF